MPRASFMIAITGLAAFVVQDAFEVTTALSNRSSFTPMRMVAPSSPFAGAVITTRFAPASMCALAFSNSVKNPVDSMTTSTESSPHGRRCGHPGRGPRPPLEDDRTARIADDDRTHGAERLAGGAGRRVRDDIG